MSESRSFQRPRIRYIFLPSTSTSDFWLKAIDLRRPTSRASGPPKPSWLSTWSRISASASGLSSCCLDGAERPLAHVRAVEDFLVVPHHLAVGDLEHLARHVAQAGQLELQEQAIGLVLDVLAGNLEVLPEQLAVLLEVGGDRLEGLHFIDGGIQDELGLGRRRSGRLRGGRLGPGQ